MAKLLRKMQARIDKARRDAATKCKVGFTSAYAIYVHENMEARHKVGQAKYLEQPARTNKPKYAHIIATQCMKGRPLGQALLIAGLELQKDAQELCPVDTGALRASAFTKLGT